MYDDVSGLISESTKKILDDIQSLDILQATNELEVPAESKLEEIHEKFDALNSSDKETLLGELARWAKNREMAYTRDDIQYIKNAESFFKTYTDAISTDLELMSKTMNQWDGSLKQAKLSVNQLHNKLLDSLNEIGKSEDKSYPTLVLYDTLPRDNSPFSNLTREDLIEKILTSQSREEHLIEILKSSEQYVRDINLKFDENERAKQHMQDQVASLELDLRNKANSIDSLIRKVEGYQKAEQERIERGQKCVFSEFSSIFIENNVIRNRPLSMVGLSLLLPVHIDYPPNHEIQEIIRRYLKDPTDINNIFDSLSKNEKREIEDRIRKEIEEKYKTEIYENAEKVSNEKMNSSDEFVSSAKVEGIVQERLEKLKAKIEENANRCVEKRIQSEIEHLLQAKLAQLSKNSYPSISISPIVAKTTIQPSSYLHMITKTTQLTQCIERPEIIIIKDIKEKEYDHKIKEPPASIGQNDDPKLAAASRSPRNIGRPDSTNNNNDNPTIIEQGFDIIQNGSGIATEASNQQISEENSNSSISRSILNSTSSSQIDTPKPPNAAIPIESPEQVGGDRDPESPLRKRLSRRRRSFAAVVGAGDSPGASILSSPESDRDLQSDSGIERKGFKLSKNDLTSSEITFRTVPDVVAPDSLLLAAADDAAEGYGGFNPQGFPLRAAPSEPEAEAAEGPGLVRRVVLLRPDRAPRGLPLVRARLPQSFNAGRFDRKNRHSLGEPARRRLAAPSYSPVGLTRASGVFRAPLLGVQQLRRPRVMGSRSNRDEINLSVLPVKPPK